MFSSRIGVWDVSSAWAAGAGPRDWFRELSSWVTSLGDLGCLWAFGLSSLDAGAGAGLVRVGGWGLFGDFAESSVHEDIGCVDAVVGGGVFSDALSDVVEHEDDFAAAVGFGEDGVGEIERRV